MTDTNKFEAAIAVLLADVERWQGQTRAAVELIEKLRAHAGIEPVPARKQPPAPVKRKKRVDDPGEAKRRKSRESMRRYRAKKAAAATPPASAPVRDPPPAGWHYDEHGNLTRLHVAVPANILPEAEALRREAEKRQRRKGNADATA
jgi:hypothetical protein